MLSLKYLIVITKREYSEHYLDFFHRHKVQGVVSNLCNGTASDSILNYFGVEKTEKVMFETIIKEDLVEDIIKGLQSEMNINASGNGIALFIPIDSVGGKSSLKYFTGDIEVQKKESEQMESKSVLITVITDKGYNDLVMESARSAGANGGTVVKAKGTGADMAKFFGISISEEKEMVYIVCARENRDDIMRAIMEKAGNNTPAHGIIFSTPVDKVVGLRDL